MPTLLKVITGANGEQFTTDRTLVHDVKFWGYSGFDAAGFPKKNTSSVYVGLKSGEYPIEVLASGSATVNTPFAMAPIRENLSNFWIKGTAPNGVYVLYY